MSDDQASDLDVPDMVHWSPRHGPTVGGPIRPIVLPLTAVGLVAAFGLAVGVLAVGVLAISRLVVGRASLDKVRIGRLDVGDLMIARRNGRPF